MSKTLIVGDIHAHFNVLDRIKELSKNYDKIIFLGDYVDDWGKPPEASYNALIWLKEFYEDNLGKVIPLLGNHCLSEWFGENFKCSGWNPITSRYVGEFMFKFHNIFKLAYAQDNYLFTHAGITKTWAKKYLPGLTKSDEIVDKLNHSFIHYKDDDESERIFMGLSEVGSERGGWGEPSPIWADINELLADPMPELNQIVGHSPVSTCLNYQTKNADLWFCDTHSTYPNGTPVGDNSLLVIENKKCYKISLDGKLLS